MKRQIELIALTLGLAGCATSLPRALSDLRPGMDKDAVLQTAGNPARTFRERGEDHWVYVYYQGDRQWLRDVVFDEGKVLQVGAPTPPKDNFTKELEATGSMEEFERKAREHESKGGQP